MGTLTVRENLSFSAALRLPSQYSFKQRKEKVDGVIEELGLMDCQNTKVLYSIGRKEKGGSEVGRRREIPMCLSLASWTWTDSMEANSFVG